MSGEKLDPDYALRLAFSLFCAVFVLALLLYGFAASAQGVDVTDLPPLPAPRDGTTLVLVSTMVGAAIRLVVSLARSERLGSVWGKASMGTRLAALAGLTAAAAAADSLATGATPRDAALTAVGGLFAAVATHEMQARAMPAKKETP